MTQGGWPNPIDFPEDWDTCTVGGVEVPGVVSIASADRSYRWDEKDGPGQTGSTATHRGRKLNHFELTTQLWLPDHFDQWARVLNVLIIDPIRKPLAALTIQHPALAALEIFECAPETVGQVEHKGAGVFEVKVKFIEFRPPPKTNATGTPKTATGSPNPPQDKGEQPTTAETEQQKRLLAEEKAAGIP